MKKTTISEEKAEGKIIFSGEKTIDLSFLFDKITIIFRYFIKNATLELQFHYRKIHPRIPGNYRFFPYKIP